jgi:uncharacterized protein (DUF305 family)
VSATHKTGNSQAAIALACLAVGIMVGFAADLGTVAPPAAGTAGGGCGAGCPMMEKKMGGMGGAHMMPDGSMMMNGDMGDMDMDMGSMMMDMTARLEGKKGDALDKIFLEDMIVHHQGAVDMAILLRDGTNRAEMKKFAEDIIRVQSAEIEQMKSWERSWFGN